MKKKSQRLQMPSEMTLATKAIHGRKLYAFQGPVSPPIVQSSNYRFANSKDAVRYSQGDPDVYVYTRYHNPTVREAEERLALMMNAENALLFSSGMAAISSAILSVVKAGDEIISTPALYGGMYRYFRDILPNHNVAVHFIHPDALGQITDTASHKTKLIYFETPTNPTVRLVDIKRLVSATRDAEKKTGHKIVTMIDNTFASIINQDPFSFDVDVVVESGTKYLGGHSDVMAGVVVGTNKFIKNVHNQLKHYGGCADPFAGYLMLRSLKTFELRVLRQNENALSLATFLEKQRTVNRVLYPGLRSHPQHVLARKQMVGSGGRGYGSIVTIELKGGVKSAVKVCDSLRVAVNAMSLGGVETLVSIPVYSSHINMTKQELKKHGVAPGMIRISVGIEGIGDLKNDFAQAFGRL